MSEIERLNRKWLNVLYFIASVWLSMELGLYLMS